MGPMKRLMDAWLSTGMTLGRFIDNAICLAGCGLRGMTDEELATAAEKYAQWRSEYKGTMQRHLDAAAKAREAI